jgi:predicted pyridoxine 5'-phosphate oxidase superfamily flavin-nucleotide-binding protein
MDYANKARLKVWARARIVYAEDEQQLLARLEASDYRARVERAVVMTIEAVDWNCPQHITPRYTEGEMEQLVTPLQNRIAELEAAAASSSEVAAGAGASV